MLGWRWENGAGSPRAGKYMLDGWTVWSTGFEWKIKSPDGYVYPVGYKKLETAKAFAERRMK